MSQDQKNQNESASSASESGFPDGSRLAGFGAQLTDEQTKAVSTYLAEMMRFNKTLNLISGATMQRADIVHFLDAILAWRVIGKKIPKGATVFDIGSGNGIPGLVFAILAPDIKFRLIDRDQRKLEFCKHVGATVGLKNVVFSNVDVESLEPGAIEYAVSRGFAPVSKSLLSTRSQFKAGGCFYMMKSEGWAREVADVPTQVFGFWSVTMVGQYRLPETSADFVILEGKKTN